MTCETKSLLLGLGLVMAVAGLPASAADFGPSRGYPSVKDYGSAGIPVPAPAPIPVTAADWYIRADLNYALRSSGNTISGGDFQFPVSNADNMPSYLGATLGVGRYITPSIRGEFALDYRTQQRYASTRGAATGTVTSTSTNPLLVVTPAGMATVAQPVTIVNHYAINYQEDGHVGNYAAMANFYYDFKNHTSFTPYVGAGIGVAMHMLRRNYSETSSCSSQDFYYAAMPQYGQAASSLMDQTCAGSFNGSGYVSSTGFGFAGALMAGFSYEMSPGILLDTGYRFMYQNGKITSTRDSVLGFSMVEIPDRIDHEIRTGLRFDID
jgi:opacity protein-like surface antigen